MTEKMLLWNVYAWQYNRPAVKVGTHLDIVRAANMVDAYLDREGWDAYMVQVYDDPGETSQSEYEAFLEKNSDLV